MGLKLLTIVQRDHDTSYAGSALFNSGRISNMQLVNTNNTYFEYAMKEGDVVKELFEVDETLTTADNVFTAVNTTFYTLPVHDDLHDSSSDTTNKAIPADDIAYGVPFGSNASKCLLWIQEGGKLEKYLVNKPLATIEDYIMTGT